MFPKKVINLMKVVLVCTYCAVIKPGLSSVCCLAFLWLQTHIKPASEELEHFHIKVHFYISSAPYVCVY